jgi:FkbM family methyltransferase
MSSCDPIANRWLNELLLRAVTAWHQYVEGNYDPLRYSGDGIDRSGEFWAQYHRDYLLFIVRHFERLYQARQALADEGSRELFDEIRLWGLVGHQHFKLSTNTTEYWSLRETAAKLPCRNSSLDVTGMFGPIKHFDLDYRGQKIQFDGWFVNVLWSFFYHPYFFERCAVAIKPMHGDIVIDGGACFGDTALAFSATVGEAGRVITFEPAPGNRAVLEHNLRQNEWSRNIEIVPAGLDNAVREIADAEAAGPVDPGFQMVEGLVATETIDHVTETRRLPRVDFIKLDIEGYELRALQGARATLARYRPRLAVSVYHRKMDPIEITEFIRSLDLGYRFYLGHYTIFNEETVLYAIT